jgi:outer membrane protein, multidrug efflux system
MHDADLQLGTMLRLPMDQELELERSKPATPSLPPLQQFLSQVIPSHPALRVQQANVEIAQQQLRLDRAARLPTAKLGTSSAAAQDLDHFSGEGFHRRPTLFLSYVAVDIPIFDFGQRSAAATESQEKILSEQARLSQLDLDLRAAINHTYEQISDSCARLAALQSDYTKANNEVALAQAQRSEGLIDELTLVDAETDLVVARVAFEAEQLTKRLLYAELQNLAGGKWRWLRQKES